MTQHGDKLLSQLGGLSFVEQISFARSQSKNDSVGAEALQ